MSNLSKAFGAKELIDQVTGKRFGDFWGNQHGDKKAPDLQHIVLTRHNVATEVGRAGSLSTTTREDIPDFSNYHDSISIFLTWGEIEALMEILDEALLDHYYGISDLAQR